MSKESSTAVKSNDELLFIIRLFSEIAIKSPPVRKRWTKHLTENIRLLMRRIHPKASVINDWDRLDVRIPSDGSQLRDQVIERLKCIPGIANFSEVVPYPFENVHQIYEAALPVWKDELAGKTFCVRVKRSGSHDFTSTEAERYIGGGLNQNTEAKGVNLKSPDVTVGIEIKDNRFFLVQNKYSGLGGFPVGTQDHVLSLISGGFDSCVASYLMIKRGMRTHFCFFNLGGRAHELAVKEVAYFLWNKYGASHRVRFITVPFEGVVSEILEKIDAANMGVVLKRMMLRASNKLAEKGNIQAVVTGEAISQVSSQTIPNLRVIDKVSEQLVLRPLIAMDKPDIIHLARQIGAEEFSATIPEYCGVISVKPSSKVNEGKLLHQEEQFNWDVLDKAIADTRVQAIDEVINDLEESDDIEHISELNSRHCVIDIRHPDEESLKPLTLAETAEVKCIPFYRLDAAFETLATDKTYLLYCEKGVMSELHAAHLQDLGKTNVGVYRPQD